jgi:hypothetical protein
MFAGPEGMTRDAYHAGAMFEESAQGLSSEELDGWFDQTNTNGGETLDWDEFSAPFEMAMEEGDWDHHEEDHDDNEANADIDEAWNRYSEDDHVTWEAYNEGFRNYYPEATDDEIAGVWWIADMNEDGLLEYHEFYRSAIIANGPPEEGKAEWYWGWFSQSGKGGIDFSQFHRGSMIENPEASEEELQGIFNNFDANADGVLDHDEFWAMIEGEN